MDKKMILIVDDEEEIREILRIQLESQGFAVLEAGNGAEALERVRAHAGELLMVLCDIRMPRMNGIEIVDALKEEIPGVPLVILSGYPDRTLENQLFQKGVRDYLVKPVEKARLLSVVRSVTGE